MRRAIAEMKALRKHEERLEVLKEIREWLPTIVTGSMPLPNRYFRSMPKHLQVKAILIEQTETSVMFADGEVYLLRWEEE